MPRCRPSLAALASLLVLSLLAAANATNTTFKPTPVKDILLVHGILMDGMVWTLGPKGDTLDTGVVALLQKKGYTIHTAQLSSNNLEEDITNLKRMISNIGRPMVVAGHAYGGMPMSYACTGEPNVTALVFINAFAVDAGESLFGLLSLFPPISPALLPPMLGIDTWGMCTLSLEGWVNFTRLTPKMATRLQAVQRPFSDVIFYATSNSTPAWKTIPSYYQLSMSDELLPLGLAEFMSKRVNPIETLRLYNTGHLSLITSASKVANLIARAAGGN